MRTADIKRKTAETDISLSLNIDGTGAAQIDTGVGFLDHMLTLFARHGRFDLKVFCRGDVQVDFHHTTEDVGIALGQAFDQALADRRGIVRYGSTVLPMDEALVLTALDISGRDYLSCGLVFPTQKVGDFDTELVEEFFSALARNMKCTLHIKQLDGRNSHHIAEAAFKSAARSFRAAAAIDPDFSEEIPSTKGVL